MKKSFIIFTISLLLEALLSITTFIPSWVRIQMITITVLLAISLITAIYFIKGYRKMFQYKWQHVTVSIFMLLAPIIAFFITVSQVSDRDGGFLSDLYFKQKYELKGKTYFLYEKDCFPDCGNAYKGILDVLYIKNKYLPIMHLKAETTFYIDSTDIINLY